MGLWVKFEIKRVIEDENRPHGIRYSLSLHDRDNKRIMGFDNAHAIEYGGKQQVAPKRKYDHWHRDKSDKGRPYYFVDAGKLIEDFWKEVDAITKQLEGSSK